MKIAILSTPTAPLPPKGYAGIERVVDTLQRDLVKKGHDVTVYATGDCEIEAKLAYFYEKALGPSSSLTYNPYYFLNNVYGFFEFVKDKDFDIIHLNDAGRLSLYFANFLKTPFVTTLHGSYALKGKDTYNITQEKRNQLLLFKDYPYVSISDSQRTALPDINYVATVYNSVQIEDFEFSSEGGEYISWLARINPDKGLDTALLVAEALGKDISFHGFIDVAQQEYFSTTIQPILDRYPEAVFLGESKYATSKSNLYKNSKLFLFPLRWDEPFGLVLLEAMACGTPVVAYSYGAVPEVVHDGVTGFIVNPSDSEIRGDYIIKKTGIEGLKEAVDRLYAMDHSQYTEMRNTCRSYIEENFTIESMGDNYLEVYRKVIDSYER